MFRNVLLCLPLAAACKPNPDHAAERPSEHRAPVPEASEKVSSQPDAELIVERAPAVSGSGALLDSIGVETLGGIFAPVLQAGCSVPCVATEVFSTAADNQSTIKIHLYIGTAPRVAADRDLGVFTVEDIPAELRGVPKIEVSFSASRDAVVLGARSIRGGRVRLVRSGGG